MFDANEINDVLNVPEIFDIISSPPIERMDCASLIEDPRNFFLACDGGHVFFIQQEPGIYETYANFLDGYRGKYAIEAARQAIAWMFINSDCMTLNIKIPSFNKVAIWFASHCGAVHEFNRDGVWITKNGLSGISFWTARYENWVKRSPDLSGVGALFVDRLFSERARLGQVEKIPTHDEVFYRNVGALAEMLFAGQMDKGVILYNRFALFAGYAPVRLVARNPAILDTGNTIIQIAGGTFKAIKCH